MVPLSVVIITFNEARNIGRCIDSVQAIADEIVVVDSFSTDQTESICREKGARFVQHAFEGHIEQKNWALTQAHYPHVLSLDADEALSPALTESIQKVKQTWAFDAYILNRRTNYCGQWIWYSGWYPDRKLRLFDRRKGSWGGQNPHDKVAMQPGIMAQWIKGDLLHYSYYSVAEHYERAKKYAQIAALARQQQGKRSWWVQVFLSPLAKFIRNYVIKRGFLDGKAGLTIAWISALETYWKYASRPKS